MNALLFNKFKILITIILTSFLLLVAHKQSMATEQYGINIPDSFIAKQIDSANTSRWGKMPFLPYTKDYATETQIEKVYTPVNKTSSFYLVILLLATLGILRSMFPTYFRNLYNAFMSPMTNKRQIREQIEQNLAANIAMNVFFCISFGFFIFTLIHLRTNYLDTIKTTTTLVLIGIIVAVAIVYLIKFGILKFVGWVFKVESVTDSYIYNVFLVNKILAVVLLPFSIILAFGTGNWLNIIFVVAVAITSILVLNRYTRSWSSLGSFFQFSKFHFFMYFCASEIFPLALLVKFAYNLLLLR